MTNFPTWSHRLFTGGAQRTLPDRLVDKINVKDFGALGTGGGDDYAAIQAAINAAANGGGKWVVFPAGEYPISAVLQNNVAGTEIQLIGDGFRFTTINPTGSFSYTIDNSGAAGLITGLRLLRVSGGVRMRGAIGGVIQSCDLYPGGAKVGLNLAGTTGVTVRNTGISGPGGSLPGYTAVITGDNTSMINSQGRGWWEWCRASGKGLFMSGCTSETNKTSFLLGKDENGNFPGLDGFVIWAHTTERNDTAVEIWNARNGSILGSEFQGTVGVGTSLGEGGSADKTIASMVWSAGIVTVTSNIAIDFTGQLIIKIDNPNNSAPYEGYHTATATGTNTFTFAAPSNQGSDPTAVWSTMQYRVIDIPPTGVVNNVTIAGCVMNSTVQVACIDMSRMSAGSSLRLAENDINPQPTPLANPFGVGILFPPDAVKPNVKFVDRASAFPFANLPSSPREGDAYDITNGFASPVVPGATVTGGGTLHARIRWNGSAWKLMGV